MKRTLALLLAALAALAAAAPAAAIDLPNTVVWTAYNTGTAGYSQAVAVGSVLKNAHGVNLRVLPGKNDVSRLTPLARGKAQFSATGSDSIYAQEAVYVFGSRQWGPQPIRLLLHNVADGCAVTFAVAADAGVREIADLAGARITWVRGAPALNKAAEALLAFAGLGWDDVERREVGGAGASIDRVVTGDAEAAIGATFSPYMVRMQASPRGLYHPPAPHADTDGWARLNRVVPWYFPHRCRQGAGVPEGGYEGVGTAYPILISTPAVPDEVAYNMTKAMYVHYPDYKDGAPGANGWEWARQRLESAFLPFHDGAVRYYRETGRWSARAEATQAANLERQAVLGAAWEAWTAAAPDDREAFADGWMTARAEALRAAGLEPIFERW